ncbi:MEDS domain-containing protein [Pedococcus sp. KACC 23699]|uniref:MEDS domain-containing protein n=1 Tax=Pedococcus sp. KACC 23699 TaxID=3149228 RepID=A0AAU7JSI1_9MICO
MLFYDHESEIVSAVAAYVHEGLQAGDTVLLVTTEGHHQAVIESLQDRGVDVLGARAAGRLDLRDARTMLDSLRTGGQLDLEAFEAAIGAVIAAATAVGTHLRIYGEMVGLLWEEGAVSDAVALEGAWNGVLAGLEASLLCAYPTALLAPTGLSGVRETCLLHSEVLAPTAYRSPGPVTDTLKPDRETDGAPDGETDEGSDESPVTEAATAQRTEVFVPTTTAVTAARRFVGATLEHWGLDHLVPDALLLVSEMATNAVLHAGSPFRVFIHRSPGVLHLSVRDAQRGWFEQGTPSAVEVNGRGVSIVEALADRWGCDAVSDGKVVWAELPTEA